jgi:hypothetical protein
VQQALWSGSRCVFPVFAVFDNKLSASDTACARQKSRVCDNRQAERETAKILAVSSLFPLFFAVLSILKSLEGDTLPRSAQMGVQDR